MRLPTGGRESRVWQLLLTAFHSLMAVRDRIGARCPSGHLIFCFYIEIRQGTPGSAPVGGREGKEETHIQSLHLEVALEPQAAMLPDHRHGPAAVSLDRVFWEQASQ